MFAIGASVIGNDLYNLFVQRSDDFGETWTKVYNINSSIPFSYIGNIISVSTSGKYVMFVLANNVFFSSNSGVTFTSYKPSSDSIIVLGCTFGQVAIGGTVPNIFVTSVSSAPFSDIFSVFRSSNGGVTWTETFQTIPTVNSTVGVITASTKNDAHQYVYFSLENSLYTSSDNGETFTSQVIGTEKTGYFTLKTNGKGNFVVTQGLSNNINLDFKSMLLDRVKSKKSVKIDDPLNFEYFLSTNYGVTFNHIKDSSGNNVKGVSQVPYGSPAMDINAQKILVSTLNFGKYVYLGENRNANNFNIIYTDDNSTNDYAIYIATNNTSSNYDSKIIFSSFGVVWIGTKI